MINVPRVAPRDSQTSGKPGRCPATQATLAAAVPLLLTLLVPAGGALAREARAPNEPPARIANVWGGLDHQPTEAWVERAEQAAGVAPSLQEQARETQIVRQLNLELLHGSGRTGAPAG